MRSMGVRVQRPVRRLDGARLPVDGLTPND